MSEQKQPQVGVSVIIIKDGKVLLGKRKGSHGAGTWAFPGGLIEKNEGFEQTCKREVKEETDLEIEVLNKNPVSITNDIFEKEKKHYITLFFRAKITSGKVKVLEPDKCESWEWFSWAFLPEPLFLPIKNLIKQEYNPLKK